MFENHIVPGKNMLDIFNFKSQKKKAPVKTSPLKLDFLDEGLPTNELDFDFVIMPESAKVKNVSSEVIDKNEKGLEEMIETIVEPVKEVTQIPFPDIGKDESDGAVSGMLNIFPSVEPANVSALANPGLEESPLTDAGATPMPLQNTDSNEDITNIPCDEKNLTAVQIEHDVGAVAAVSPESHTIPDLSLTGHEIEENSGDAGVKEKGRYDEVLLQILEIARGDPRDYGWKSHSLRNLQKYLIAKKIVKKISHETLRNILAENNIHWNGNGDYHKNKKKPAIKPGIEMMTVLEARSEKETIIEKAVVRTMTVDECAGVSDAVGKSIGDAMSKGVGETMGKAAGEAQHAPAIYGDRCIYRYSSLCEHLGYENPGFFRITPRFRVRYVNMSALSAIVDVNILRRESPFNQDFFGFECFVYSFLDAVVAVKVSVFRVFYMLWMHWRYAAYNAAPVYYFVVIGVGSQSRVVFAHT